MKLCSSLRWAALATAAFILATPTWATNHDASPYNFEGQYRLDYWTGLSGPLQDRWRHAGNLDLRFGVDADKAWGWKNARLFVHAIANHGNHPNVTQAAAQGIDNIEVSVQPDVQWVRNHGNPAPNKASLLTAVRLDFTF